MEDIGNRVIEVRSALGLSQREVAERLNIRQATVSAWETEEATPSRGNLRLLADLCHDSRLVYRWLIGEGTRPRLQPYMSKREERADAAATYGFGDETEVDEFNPAEKAEELAETLETARRVAGELALELERERDGDGLAGRQALMSVQRALDGAYHALAIVRDAADDEERPAGG